MKLRLRLALTTVAVLVPVVVGAVWTQQAARLRAGEEMLADRTLEMMQSGERDRCEAAPARWGGPSGQVAFDAPAAQAGAATPHAAAAPPIRWMLRWGPPPLLFAYDDALHAHNPAAPPLEPALVEPLRAGRDVAARRRLLDGQPVLETLVRMPWRSGPCAYVLARGPSQPLRWAALAPSLKLWIAPLAIAFAAVLLAVGPIVRRVRRLTEDVVAAAATGYLAPVPATGHDEIAELARTFNAAGQEIREQLAEKERRERALREFVANTTHDVMMPLTVLKGHLATLRERLGDDAAVVKSAMDEAHYMAALIHNLSVAAKLQSHPSPLHRGAVPLDALVARVVARHAPIARELQVALESAVPEETLTVEGDVTLLEQAVSNVVYNAVRHNRPGGHAAVILERQGATRFRLAVIDDGPGIPAAERSRILERGFRTDAARTRAPDGQGIGLDITQRVAELHGLVLTLEPSHFGGLEVRIAGALYSA